MIFSLHGVFLTYLLLLVLWNRLCSRLTDHGERPVRRALEARVLVPLQVVLTVALVRDRLAPGDLPWLGLPAVALAFPLAFALGLAQNVSAILARGARLSDIPVVIYNVGIGACVTYSAWTLLNGGPGAGEAPLLYDYGVVTRLIGSYLALLGPPTWMLPLCVRRTEPQTFSALLGGLVFPAVGAFAVMVLVAFHGQSQAVVNSFGFETGLARLPADLRVGIVFRPDVPAFTPEGNDAAPPPGDLSVWTLPADHSGAGLPRDGRPLVVLLRFPDRWAWRKPPPDVVLARFEQAAVRLAEALRPEVLLPFPEPDGEATLAFPAAMDPDAWAAVFERTRAAVAAVSPETRIAVRFAGVGPRSRTLYERLAPHADIAGPRLHPDSEHGAAAADRILATWDTWRAGPGHDPDLWILATGCSALAYGEFAQARFVQGCLARAVVHRHIDAVIVEGWRDLGHSLGMLRPSGRPRQAGLVLQRLLADRP